MNITTVQFGSITPVFTEIYRSPTNTQVKTFVEYSYTGNVPVYVEWLSGQSTIEPDIADTWIKILPNTKGTFDRTLTYLRIKSETELFPTSGTFTFSAIDNTNGTAEYGLNPDQLATSVLPTDLVQVEQNGVAKVVPVYANSTYILKSKPFWATQTSPTLSAALEFLTVYEDILIPANSLGLNGIFSRLKLECFFNVANAASISDLSIRMYLGTGTQFISATNIAATSSTASRYGRFICDINYNIHAGQTNLTQARSYTEQLLTGATVDNNAGLIDSSAETFNAIDWTIDQTLQIRVRALNAAGGTLTFGSRNYSVTGYARVL